MPHVILVKNKADDIIAVLGKRNGKAWNDEEKADAALETIQPNLEDGEKAAVFDLSPYDSDDDED